MKKLFPYLQLMRLPAVFTALADIFLGYLLNLQHRLIPVTGEFCLLLTSSACLYLAGMVLNDFFDRKIDAVERPGRPIPSGEVSPRAAASLGTALLLGGICAASLVGMNSLIIAGGLSLLIVGYDAVLKQTFLGPIAMGGCRFLNVMLGASAAGKVWDMPQLHVAAGLGVYIIGVTWFARTEAVRSRRTTLVAALGVVNLGLAVLVGFVRYWGIRAEAEPELVYALLAVIFLTINRRMTSAISDPAPQKVQAAVGVLLMSLVMLDATMVYFQTARSVDAAMTAALLIPAMLLRRVIPMT